MMNKLILFCLSSCLALLMVTCRKDGGPVIILPPVPDKVCFSQDIQPIFTANCISCHDESHPSLNLKSCCSWYELFTTGYNAPYVDTINPSESLLYKRISGLQLPMMPPTGQLQQTDIDLILRWIEEGAANN